MKKGESVASCRGLCSQHSECFAFQVNLADGECIFYVTAELPSTPESFAFTPGDGRHNCDEVNDQPDWQVYIRDGLFHHVAQSAH